MLAIRNKPLSKITQLSCLRCIILRNFSDDSSLSSRKLNSLRKDHLHSIIPNSLKEKLKPTGRNGQLLKKDIVEFILQNAEKIKKIRTEPVPNTLTPSMLEIGGLDDAVEELNERLWLPLKVAPNAAKQLGIAPTNAVLFHGPPGCGKSLLAVRLANLLNPKEPPHIVRGPELLSRFYGEAEEKVRDLFDPDSGWARDLFESDYDSDLEIFNNSIEMFPPGIATVYSEERDRRARQYNNDPFKDDEKTNQSSNLKIVILDEADCLLQTRGSDYNRNMDSVVAQFLSCMDGAGTRQQEKATSSSKNQKHVLMIATTNNVDAIDPAFFRPGRFEVNIHFQLPYPAEREEILKLKTSDSNMDGCARDFLPECALRSTGFSGADLDGLVRSAKMKALLRFSQQLDNSPNNAPVSLQRKDLEQALTDELSRRQKDWKK